VKHPLGAGIVGFLAGLGAPQYMLASHQAGLAAEHRALAVAKELYDTATVQPVLAVHKQVAAEKSQEADHLRKIVAEAEQRVAALETTVENQQGILERELRSEEKKRELSTAKAQWVALQNARTTSALRMLFMGARAMAGQGLIYQQLGDTPEGILEGLPRSQALVQRIDRLLAQLHRPDSEVEVEIPWHISPEVDTVSDDAMKFAKEAQELMNELVQQMEAQA
jgi:Skp family chaperone for outer membrane proteins